MKIKEIQQKVYEANLELVRHNLVLFTWGNASAIDREQGFIAIKPSGVSYEDLKPDMIPILSLDGKLLDGKLKPSSDTQTHLVLYKAFSDIGGIVHTHSTFATVWAQARRDIPSVGTTHADYFYREIPCTRNMSKDEIFGDYETETGNVIVDCFSIRNLDPNFVPAVLVANHGPFAWGKNVDDAVYNAVVLEEVAKMALFTASLNSNLPMNPHLLEKHFNRKHGPNAYYGQ